MKLMNRASGEFPDSPTASATAGDVAQSASDTVFYGIVNGLEMQIFVPAQRLVELDLAAQFGVGRNSVREALQKLAAEGFVELSRHKGAAIRRLSAHDALDVLDVAERMTGLLARSASASTSIELSQALKSCLKDMVAGDGSNDSVAFARGRRTFYRTLLDMSGSKELQRLFPAIQMPIVHAQFRIPALQKIRIRDYKKIASAVVAGKAGEADSAGMSHVQHVREEILRGLGASSAATA
ncbi:MAG: GntR family transcriptional regulator [Pseudomonadota bacterium]